MLTNKQTGIIYLICIYIIIKSNSYMKYNHYITTKPLTTHLNNHTYTFTNCDILYIYIYICEYYNIYIYILYTLYTLQLLMPERNYQLT